MRDKWYADNRDLIKWATLSHIARMENLRTIIQVPYWRPDESRPHFDFRNKRVPVSDDVWGFFRNIKHINGLAAQIAVSITVVASQFNPNQREAYITEVCALIKPLRRPLLLFLDPDKGLQPVRCTPKHTSLDEVTSHLTTGWSYINMPAGQAVGPNRSAIKSPLCAVKQRFR